MPHPVGAVGAGIAHAAAETRNEGAVGGANAAIEVNSRVNLLAKVVSAESPEDIAILAVEEHGPIRSAIVAEVGRHGGIVASDWTNIQRLCLFGVRVNRT